MAVFIAFPPGICAFHRVSPLCEKFVNDMVRIVPFGGCRSGVVFAVSSGGPFSVEFGTFDDQMPVLLI